MNGTGTIPRFGLTTPSEGRALPLPAVLVPRIRPLAFVVAMLAAGLVLAQEQTLVLEDGRRFQVVGGGAFEVPASQIAEPSLDSIPVADGPRGPAAPAPPGTRTLVLQDGRRIQVTRLERRGDRVRLSTLAGDTFEVAVSDIVEPPLESIPIAGQSPGPDEVREQVLELSDGRRINVLRLARRGGLVIFQTTRGEGFAVPETQVVSPPLESIPVLDAETALAEPEEPEPPFAAEQPEAPGLPEPAVPAPVVPVQPDVPVEGVPDFVPIPDRWTIPFPQIPRRTVEGRRIDPYNQNILKGDEPVIGDSVFLVLGATLDTPTEYRRIPVSSSISPERPASDAFSGQAEQFFTTPRLFLSAELFKGQAAFKPRTWALKLTPAFNVNYLDTQGLADRDVSLDGTRKGDHVSLEEAFVEVKIADLSPRYDAVSLRAGIQFLVSDFRGLVFSDFNLGARLFGNLDGNRWQYNLAYFELLEKETNSRLNSFDSREHGVMIANVFRQDLLADGHTLELSYHGSRDRATEEAHYDANGALVRPARIGEARLHDVTTHYLGVAGDGHLGRVNVTHAYYYVFGEDEDNALAGRPVDVRAHMAALQLSVDRDWARFRTAAFFASGDGEPTDGTASGFDVIYDFANFVGGPFSFWTLTPIPLTRTNVFLKGPFSLVPSLRSNKFEGQANHVNPGVVILNRSLDLDLTPKLRATLNANYLRFHRTEPLEELLSRPDIGHGIGVDLGAGVLYRPLLNENIVITAGVSGLIPGSGFDDLFTSTCRMPGCGQDTRSYYNVFFNLRLRY